MKHVIILVPSIVSDIEIKEAAQQFAAHLDMEGLTCIIANENEIQIKNPAKPVYDGIDAILKEISSDNPITTFVKFWTFIKSNKIPKSALIALQSNRTITQKYLKQKNAEWLLGLIDEALLVL